MDTRIDHEDREPKAIRLRKPSHKKRNIIIASVSAILVIALGVSAWYLIGNGIITLPKVNPSEETNSVADESEPALSSSESEPEIIESEPEIIESEPEKSSKSEEAPKEPTAENTDIKSEWYMLLVNKQNPLNEDFTVETKQIEGSNITVDARIYDDLMAMLSAGEAEGLKLKLYTGFRSSSKQQSLYEAGKTSAPGGTSEHNCGLAVDIVSANGDFEGSPEQAWLLKHAHEYGFILRYPEGKENITGFAYEPWHYRYVGIEQAKLINQSGLCLEEYLNQ